MSKLIELYYEMTEKPSEPYNRKALNYKLQFCRYTVDRIITYLKNINMTNVILNNNQDKMLDYIKKLDQDIKNINKTIVYLEKLIGYLNTVEEDLRQLESLWDKLYNAKNRSMKLIEYLQIEIDKIDEYIKTTNLTDDDILSKIDVLKFLIQDLYEDMII